MVEILYDLIYSLPLCLFAVQMGKDLGFLGTEGLGVYVLIAVLVAVCTTFVNLKERIRFLFPGGLMALALGTVLVQKPDMRQEFLLEHQWMLLCALLVFVGYLLAQLEKRIVLLRRLIGIGLLIWLIVAMAVPILVGKVVVASALFGILICVVEEIQKHWKKRGYTDSKEHLVYISPFLVGLILMVYLLPAPEKAYDWKFVINLWERATENIKISIGLFQSGSEDYRDAFIGFSEKAEFGLGLKKKKKDMMEIAGGKDVGPVVYLSGKVFDTFDGLNWQVENPGMENGRNLDAIETISSVLAYDPEYRYNYLWTVHLQVKFLDFHSRHLFVPLKILEQADSFRGIKYTKQGTDYYTEKALSYGTQYEMVYYRLNQNHNVFREFMNAEHPMNADIWSGGLTHLEWNKREGLSYDDYLLYRENINRYYLQEVLISEPLTKYLSELLEGAESDYEKCKRLEELLDSMKYNQAPGGVPKDVTTAEDFLDYFLLEKQEGYCTYFATAFVLLARSQGIPARYVQGYYVPKGEALSAMVRSSMAHAWAEVYIENVGWICFDPTPGYGSKAAWTVRVKVDPNQEIVGQIKPEEISEEPDVIPLPEPVEAQEQGFRFPVEYIIAPVVLLFVFGCLFLFVDRLITGRWYKALNAEDKFRVLCMRNLRVLKGLGYSLTEGETLEEFVRRILPELSFEETIFLMRYEEFLYGKRAVLKDSLGEALKVNAYLLKRLRSEKGFWSYLFMVLFRQGKEKIC